MSTQAVIEPNTANHLERQIQKLKSHLAQRPNDKPAYGRLMDLEIALFNQKNGLVKNRSKKRKPKSKVDKITPEVQVTKGDPGAPKHVLKAPVPITQGAPHVVWNTPAPKDKTKTSKRKLPIVETDRVLCSPAWLEFELPYDPVVRQSVVDYFSRNFSCNVSAYIKLWLEDVFGNDARRAREYVKDLVPMQWDTIGDIVANVYQVCELTGEPMPTMDTVWAAQNLNKFRVSMQQRVRDMITDYLLRQLQQAYDKKSKTLPSDFVSKNGLKNSLRAPFESMCRSYLTNLMRSTCAKQSAEQARLLRSKAETKISKAENTKSESKSNELLAQADVLIARAEEIEQSPAVSGFPLIAEDGFSLEDAENALNDFYVLLHSDEIIGNHTAVNNLQSVVKSATSTKYRQTTRGWQRNNTVIAQGMVAQRQQASIVYNLSSQNIEMVVVHGAYGAKRNLDDLVYLDGEPLSVDSQILPTQSTHKLVSRPRHDYIRWHNKHIENHDQAAPAHKRGYCKSFQFVIVRHNKTKQQRMFVRPLFNFATPSSGYLRFEKGYKFRYHIGIDIGINNVFYAAVYDTELMNVTRLFSLEHDKVHRLKVAQRIAKLQSKLDSSKALQQSDRLRLRREIGKLRRQLRDLKTPIRKAVSDMIGEVEQKYGRGNYCFYLEGINPNSMFGSKNMARLRHATAIGFVQETLVAQMAKIGYYTFKTNGKTGVECVSFVSAYGTSKITPSGNYLGENVDEMYGRNIGRFVSKNPDQNGNYPMGELVGIPGVKYKVLHVDNQPHVDWGQELMRDIDGKVYNADCVAAINIAIRPSVKAQNPELSKQELCDAQAKFMSGVTISCEIPTYEIQPSDEFGQVLKIANRP